MPPPPTRKAPKPWDIRPKQPVGTATADDLYRAVGMALTSWEYVENALADIFAVFVGAPEISPSNEPAMRAYGAVASFKSRSAMLQVAAQAFFQLNFADTDDPEVSALHIKLHTGFADLIRRAEGFADRRNNIAHGIVGHSIRGAPRGHYLMPPSYSTKKYPLSEIPVTVWERVTYAFTAEDVNYYRAQFEDLYDDLYGFGEELRFWRKPKPVS